MSVKFGTAGFRTGRVLERGDQEPFLRSFYASRIPMLIADARRPDNPTVFVNEAFSALTGYAPEEIVGLNCRLLQGPETDPETVHAIRHAVQSGGGIETDILNYRKDGTRFWNALVINPVTSETGDLLYFTSSHRDVSDKKRAELELANLRNVLNENLQYRIRDLQTALDQKTKLLCDADHRVKNNLQEISSLVLLKARRMRDERAQRALYRIAERIGALSTAHRLLSTAGGAGRLDLCALVGDLSDDLMARMPHGQVRLEMAVEPIAVPAEDAAPLALLVDELVSNALMHAYPNGRHGRLGITVTQIGSDLRMVIEDDGIGLAPAASADEDLGEEGLGKSLVELLIRQLRARIAWEDAGPGTRVMVTKPLGREENRL